MDHYEVQALIDAAKQELETKIADLQYQLDNERSERRQEDLDIRRSMDRTPLGSIE